MDDGPEEPVLFFEMALIFGQELVKVMEKDAVKDGALGMTGRIDSSHSREEYSGNRPEECVHSFSLEMTAEDRLNRSKSLTEFGQKNIALPTPADRKNHNN